MLSAVDALLNDHEGREDELFEDLQREYVQLQLMTEEEPSSENGEPPKPTPARRKSTVVSRDEGEEKSDDKPLSAEQKRRPSFIVSAMKQQDGDWAVNVQNEELKEKMLQSGANEEQVDAILSTEKEKLEVDVVQQADV